jgi:hypothetical protein
MPGRQAEHALLGKAETLKTETLKPEARKPWSWLARYRRGC